MFDAFYSDPHFGHKNIIRFCERPYRHLQEMHQALVDNYNSVVTKSMTVLWCGDAFFRCGPHEAKYWLKQLNGKKIIVRGNHDPSDDELLTIGFQLVAKEMVIDVMGYTCRASHYPYAFTEAEREARRQQGLYVDDRYLERRPVRNEGEYLIHGHTHSNEKMKNNMIHVGVDAWNYAPAMYDQIADLICSEKTA